MTVTIMARIKWRRDTAAELTAANPTLLPGEPIFESDTGKFKINLGASPLAWNSIIDYALGGLPGDVGPDPLSWWLGLPGNADKTAEDFVAALTPTPGTPGLSITPYVTTTPPALGSVPPRSIVMVVAP